MKKKIAIGVFLVCFAIRLIYGWRSLMIPEFALSNDGYGYLSLAAELTHGRFPSLFRTPGYPLFLVLTGGFPGASLAPTLLSQMILDSLTAVILALIAWRLWGNQRVSLLTGLLYSISTVAAKLSGMIMSETLSVFLLAVAFLLALSRPSRINTTAQALCWVGLTMARPFCLLIPLVISAFVLLWFRREGGDWSRRWKSQAVILTFYVVCIAAWIGWNYHRSGMAILCTNPDVAFYIHEIPSVRMIDQLSWAGYLRAALLQPREYDRLSLEHQKDYAREKIPDANPPLKDLWLTQDDPASIRRIRADAAVETRGRLADLIFIHLTGALVTMRPRWASATLPTTLLDVLRISLIPIAVIALIRNRRYWILTLFCVWMLYVVLPPGPCGTWRYRSVAEPIISLTLAFGLTLIFSRTGFESKSAVEV